MSRYNSSIEDFIDSIPFDALFNHIQDCIGIDGLQFTYDVDYSTPYDDMLAEVSIESQDFVDSITDDLLFSNIIRSIQVRCRGYKSQYHSEVVVEPNGRFILRGYVELLYSVAKDTETSTKYFEDTVFGHTSLFSFYYTENDGWNF